MLTSALKIIKHTNNKNATLLKIYKLQLIPLSPILYECVYSISIRTSKLREIQQRTSKIHILPVLFRFYFEHKVFGDIPVLLWKSPQKRPWNSHTLVTNYNSHIYLQQIKVAGNTQQIIPNRHKNKKHNIYTNNFWKIAQNTVKTTEHLYTKTLLTYKTYSNS